MTSYRPYRQPAAPFMGAGDGAGRPDHYLAAASRVVLTPSLPVAEPVQVPWSVKAWNVLAACLFAVAIICGFAAGAVVIASVFDGPIVVVAFIAYAVGFGVVCRKLRL